MSVKKILVAFFSHPGENYSNGKMVELKKGNTAVAAEKIAAQTGGDLFEISTVETYPHAYKECVAASVAELRANARPALARDVDVSAYDAVILGYPNWCGTMPMAVCTFLEGHDFSHTAILPFCTNEGSGMGTSEADLKKLTPGCDVRPGLPLHGSSVDGADGEIRRWLERELGGNA